MLLSPPLRPLRGVSARPAPLKARALAATPQPIEDARRVPCTRGRGVFVDHRTPLRSGAVTQDSEASSRSAAFARRSRSKRLPSATASLSSEAPSRVRSAAPARRVRRRRARWSRSWPREPPTLTDLLGAFEGSLDRPAQLGGVSLTCFLDVREAPRRHPGLLLVVQFHGDSLPVEVGCRSGPRGPGGVPGRPAGVRALERGSDARRATAYRRLRSLRPSLEPRSRLFSVLSPGGRPSRSSPGGAIDAPIGTREGREASRRPGRDSAPRSFRGPTRPMTRES